MPRLEKIQELYLGQTIEEFLDNDGNVDEYARRVFTGEVFGPGQEVVDEDLEVLTAEDLADALRGLVERAQEERGYLPRDAAGRFADLDPESPTVLVQVKMPAALRDAVDVAAQERGLRRSDAIREALTAWLAR